ncbi:YadA-like family protein [Pasteurella atlantica]|uniref:YadA-like family protein n=1 Tax=Pasteurella atlantica TaxID=2827233 RepID=UPI00278BF6DE|nr:YadA-like family protein [Pasteurella atlantica]MDP8090355.1 YadA-like family protein [Pasteurella atlantica]
MNTKNNKKTTVATLLFLSLTTSFVFAEPSQQDQIDALRKQVEGLQKQLQKLTAQPKIQTYATATPDSTDDPAKAGTGTGSIVLNNGIANGKNAIVGGATSNTASGENSVSLGGTKNIASGKASVVIGGGFYKNGKVVGNKAAGLNSSVIGGVENSINKTGLRSSVIGGWKNRVSSEDSITLGGQENTITNSGISNAIFVGQNNTIENVNKGNVIIGGAESKIHGGAGYDNFILGGGDRNADGNEIRKGDNDVIIGGYASKIISDGKWQDNNVILGGHHNEINSNTKDGFIIGGVKSIVNGSLSGSIGGVGNNITGNGSYVIGGSKPNAGKKSVDTTYGNTVSGNNSFVIGGKNTIVGNLSYTFGNNNTINKEKVYILGSNIDAGNATRAVVLGDSSTAVTDAVSVGTTAKPRNIKHVKNGEISDTSLDAINGSQVTTIGSLSSAITVILDATITDHRHYKINLDKTKLPTAGQSTNIQGSTTVDIADDGTTPNTKIISVKAGSIGSTQLDTTTTNILNKVGAGSVASGNANTVTGGDIYTAVSGAKTKVSKATGKAGEYITLTSTESTDTTANEYTIGLDFTKVKTGLAKGNITGDGISVAGGENATFKNVILTIANNAITTSKIKNGNVTKEKLSSDVQTILNQVTTNQTNINNKISKADLKGSNTVALTEKNGKTEFSVVNGSIGSTQLDTTTNNILNKVGKGQVVKDNKNTVTGDTVYTAISGAKTKVDVTGKYLTINKTESTNTVANSYTVGLALDKVEEGLADGTISGTGITVKNGKKSTFTNVQLGIADKAITTAKVADKAITEAKIANETVKKFTAKSRETVVPGSDALTVTPAKVKANTDNQKFVVDLSAKTKAALKQTELNVKNVTTNTQNIAVNKAEIAKLKAANDKLNKRAISGAAIAGAMANLPQEYLPGRSMVAVGTAHYRGTTAFSLGLSTILDNGKWILKGSVSSDLREETMVGAGAGYSW